VREKQSAQRVRRAHFPSGSESDTLSPESVLPLGPDAELTPSAGESADFRRAEAPIVGAITAFHLLAPYFQSAPASRGFYGVFVACFCGVFLWPFLWPVFAPRSPQGGVVSKDTLLAARQPTQRGAFRSLVPARTPSITL
jgi:hypothetical protein